MHNTHQQHTINNITSTTSYQQYIINSMSFSTSRQQHLINNIASTTSHQQHLINNISSTTSQHQHFINNMSSTTFHQQHVINNTSFTPLQQQHLINNISSTTSHQHHLTTVFQQQELTKTSKITISSAYFSSTISCSTFQQQQTNFNSIFLQYYINNIRNIIPYYSIASTASEILFHTISPATNSSILSVSSNSSTNQH